MTLRQSTRRLLELSSSPLSVIGPEIKSRPIVESGALANELFDLLSERNGFYAFESALHVFPSGESATVMSLDVWNSQTLWRNQYGELADGCVFFAEDVFGGQFCLADNAVHAFNPETGLRERIASTLEEWAAALLRDYRLLTGWPLAHEWQEKYGSLPEGRKLVPIIPFVLGGEFSIENLRDGEAVKAMRFYADIARQIRDLPDGASIRLRTTS